MPPTSPNAEKIIVNTGTSSEKKLSISLPAKKPIITEKSNLKGTSIIFIKAFSIIVLILYNIFYEYI